MERTHDKLKQAIEHTDAFYMQRCLHLAQRGIGHVAPNPMVGCVIVHNDVIIGEGYHMKFGEAHAEVNAINAVKNKELLKKATLYVNLEPCAHYGKTPPCVDLIIKYNIPIVVIACMDSTEKVAGKGIEKLKSHGCDVRTGILEAESRRLNKRFFTFHEKKRPYIILKWAQTKDGFIDRIREENAPIQPNWIMGEETRVIVHKWRTEENGIMIGTRTALNDNPSLTARDWPGKNPVRIVLDRQLKLSKSLSIFNTEAPCIIFNEVQNHEINHLKYIRIEFNETIINQVCLALYTEGIQSVIIEGGTTLLNSFLNDNLWDEARVFTGNVLYKQGLKAPLISKFNTYHTWQMGKETLNIYTNNL